MEFVKIKDRFNEKLEVNSDDAAKSTAYNFCLLFSNKPQLNIWRGSDYVCAHDHHHVIAS